MRVSSPGLGVPPTCHDTAQARERREQSCMSVQGAKWTEMTQNEFAGQRSRPDTGSPSKDDDNLHPATDGRLPHPGSPTRLSRGSTCMAAATQWLPFLSLAKYHQCWLIESPPFLHPTEYLHQPWRRQQMRDDLMYIFASCCRHQK